MPPPAGRWRTVTPYARPPGGFSLAGEMDAKPSATSATPPAALSAAAARAKLIAARGRGEAPPSDGFPVAAAAAASAASAPAPVGGACPRCARMPGPRDMVCAMCGEMLPKLDVPVLHATVPEKSDSWITGAVVAPKRRFGHSVSEDLRFLAIGMLLAPVLALTPLLR